MKKMKVWFSILLAFTVLHSTITVFYNFPITPFAKKFNRVINTYMDPLFNQTWTLFAPNPVNTNTKIEVKLSHGNNQETGWVSFSDTILEQAQKSFLSHYQFYSDALTQMEGDVKKASESMIDELKNEEKEDLLDKLSNENFFRENGSRYVNDLIEEENIEDFLKENLAVNSLYGMIYDYYDDQFSNINDMQIRIISEIFPEYGQSEEAKYHFFYLPRLKVNQLISKNIIE